MTPSLPDTPTIGLGRFIKDFRFIVPNHQRDFSWTDVYVRAFLRDVEDALKNQNAIYFCGLMVFTRKAANVLKVLDGQQRLATTVMIFSAIRNWFRRYGSYHKDEILIDSQLLKTEEIGSTAVEPKLTLTTP